MARRVLSFFCFWPFQDLGTRPFQSVPSQFTITRNWVIDVFIKSIRSYAYIGSFESLIGLALLLVLVTCFLSSLIPRPPKEISHSSRTALQALQAVLVPTCSLWPARYIHLVKCASTNLDHGSRSKIVVPLSMLLHDVCDGVTELRDPVSDLEDLMDGGISAYGCSVCLGIDWMCWVEWFGRVLQGYTSDDPFHLPTNTQLVRLLAKTSSLSVIDLDSKPLEHLADIQLREGFHTRLEFTSLSSGISVFSPTFILCMMPLLWRRLPHRLADVLAAVNDTEHLKLSSLINSSVTYANTLAAASSMLTDDPVARKLFVDRLGVKGWRERKLMLEFEAALVRKGWLQHWEVVLGAR